MSCKNSLLFWNVISKFVCFFKCLLSLGNIPKAENCLAHCEDSPGALGPRKEHCPFPLSSFLPLYSQQLPSLPRPLSLFSSPFPLSLFSTAKVPRNLGVLIPYRPLGLDPLCWHQLVEGDGRPVAMTDPKLDDLVFLTSDLFPQPNQTFLGAMMSVLEMKIKPLWHVSGP